eukprot:SAG11_NODE_3266_length_2569_cov_1.207287_1_plen_147_part_10
MHYLAEYGRGRGRWTKTAINSFFSSRAHSDWHIWLNLVLLVQCCASLVVRPYTNAVDRALEPCALLALMYVIQVIDQYPSFESDVQGLAFVIVGVLAPFIVRVLYEYLRWKHTKTAANKFNSGMTSMMKDMLHSLTSVHEVTELASG